MSKYGLEKTCEYCGVTFITKPRYVLFCSAPCKNPINRKGHIAWNKGIKLTEEQKAKQNIDGLAKGRGWNKGIPNDRQREKWLANNPNKNGRLNNLRPKNPGTEPLAIYRGLVRKATYRTIKKMRKLGEWVPKLGKYKHSWQTDHIIPHQQGWELGILPQLLGSKQNIQFIKGDENRKKWDTYQPLDVVEEIIGDIDGIFKSRIGSL
jgi:hypothetical protein